MESKNTFLSILGLVAAIALAAVYFAVSNRANPILLLENSTTSQKNPAPSYIVSPAPKYEEPAIYNPPVYTPPALPATSFSLGCPDLVTESLNIKERTPFYVKNQSAVSHTLKLNFLSYRFGPKQTQIITLYEPGTYTVVCDEMYGAPLFVLPKEDPLGTQFRELYRSLSDRQQSCVIQSLTSPRLRHLLDSPDASPSSAEWDALYRCSSQPSGY